MGARDLCRYTWTSVCCILRAFRQTGNWPRPMQSGPQGKSELCVQRADWTGDHCQCHSPRCFEDVSGVQVLECFRQCVVSPLCFNTRERNMFSNTFQDVCV